MSQSTRVAKGHHHGPTPMVSQRSRAQRLKERLEVERDPRTREMILAQLWTFRHRQVPRV